MAAILCFELVSSYDDFAALEICACVMIMKAALLLILSFGFQTAVLSRYCIVLFIPILFILPHVT